MDGAEIETFVAITALRNFNRAAATTLLLLLLTGGARHSKVHPKGRMNCR